MKHILKIPTFFLLLHSSVLLPDAVSIPSQQAFNTIVSDDVTLSDNNGGAQRSVEVSTPISFSVEHKPFRHHTASPQHNLECMSTEQLVWFFTAHNYTQDQILRYPLLYMRSAYLAIAKQLPKYSAYVKMYHDEYKKFNWFTKGLGRILFIYTPKLQRQFAMLWRECEEQKIAQEKCEQAQRDLRAQQEQEARERKEAEEHAKYAKELERVENIIRDGDCNGLSINDSKRRLDALKGSQQYPERKLRKLQAGPDALAFAQDYGITEQQIANVTMNHYEYQLHKEFVGHIHSAIDFKTKYNIHEQNVFIDVLGNGIAIGIKSNHLHNPEWATRWADFGHEAVEIIRGIGDGIVLGSYNTVDMVMHPVRTLARMVDGVRMLGSLTARTIGTLAHLNYLIERGEYLQFATEVYGIGEQVCTLAISFKEHASQMSNRDIAKNITVFGTEWALTGQMFMMGHTLCSNMGQVIQKTIRFLKEESKAGEFVLATVDGVLVRASENINKGGGGVSNIVRNARTVLEAVHAEYMAGLKVELEALRLICDSKVKDAIRFGNKYLKPEYEHILGMELIFGRNEILSKISGFHHDIMNFLEKSGVIEFTNKVIYENGFYKATLLHNGNIVKKMATFFPADWSRKQVIETIYEAYTDFIKSGMKPVLEPNGKYRVDAVLNKQVTIRMYITKDAAIKTAYPILE